MKQLYKEVFTTPLGEMVAASDDHSLYCVAFSDQPQLERRIAAVATKLGCTVSERSSPVLQKLREELAQYFAGDRTTFSLPVAAVGTVFQQAAWDALQQIPYGKTVTYSQQAAVMGMPLAVRAVANANAANMCALIVPCHRVITKAGAVCGYNGGVWRKQWLLEHEKRVR
ncbi:MAG: methylated-DNA--[protein]-cysteine S-methyltransferase [bacterium]